MKNQTILLTIILILLILLISYRRSMSAENKITVEEVKKKLDNKEDIFILDVRTGWEYERAHIKEAYLIPIQHVELNLDKIPRDKDVIVLCAIGGRSKAVVKTLLKNGYTRVFDMVGGMHFWRKRKYPLEQAKPK